MRERARIRLHPERAVPDEAAAIVAQGMVVHVGFVQDGQPFVIPFGYQFDPDQPDRLYIHSAKGGRAASHLASGAPLCVSITLLDGLVYSRSARYHSMNYRSVVGFGRARQIVAEVEQRAIYDRMTRRYFPGRTIGLDYDAPSEADLSGTALLEIQVEEWSAKARRGGPLGPRDAPPEGPGTRGVVPVERPAAPGSGLVS
ncbi:MAG: pyridoxamine 5'-phosphate oxidase family protein [Chloroflexi bacterium]|nr:pyridoxamine 5'-phosphate oxidase family protein [Chloroflexota bacterium]